MRVPPAQTDRARREPARSWTVDRRDFLRISITPLAGLVAGGTAAGGAEQAAGRRGVRFGLVADPHYADANQVGTRFYRESLGKVREAVDALRKAGAEFMVELGDLKDMVAGEPDTRTLSYLTAIEAEIARFGGPTYHVLGNHDMDNLSKAQFLAGVVNTGIVPNRAYYAFSRGGIRFITLDACCLKTGADYDHGNFDWRETYVPAPQLDWLRDELTASADPVVLFCHQRLDDVSDPCVKNSPDVRSILEASGKVIAAFHGHDHPGRHSVINGIHYYTLKAVVEGTGLENNAYAAVEVQADLNIVVTGYRRATSVAMAKSPR
jgi:3',5'-cyclic AMP phosphodiesterase CpdA